MITLNIFELQREKTYLLKCAKQRLKSNSWPSCSVIRVSTVYMKNFAFLAIQNVAREDYDLNLCWVHMSEGTFSDAGAH